MSPSETCFHIGGTSGNRLSLKLYGEEKVEGTAQLIQADESQLEFAISGTRRLKLLGNHSGTFLKLQGGTLIQTGGILLVSGEYGRNGQGAASWEYKPEKGEPIGEKDAALRETNCS